jgi:hypothetical protein
MLQCRRCTQSKAPLISRSDALLPLLPATEPSVGGYCVRAVSSRLLLHPKNELQRQRQPVLLLGMADYGTACSIQADGEL